MCRTDYPIEDFPSFRIVLRLGSIPEYIPVSNLFLQQKEEEFERRKLNDILDKLR